VVTFAPTPGQFADSVYKGERRLGKGSRILYPYPLGQRLSPAPSRADPSPCHVLLGSSSPTVAIATLGCKVNQFESAAFATSFIAHGLPVWLEVLVPQADIVGRSTNLGARLPGPAAGSSQVRRQSLACRPVLPCWGSQHQKSGSGLGWAHTGFAITAPKLRKPFRAR